MSYLAPKLDKRVQFLKGVDTPNSSGGFDRSYETLLTCWGAVKNESRFIQAIRNEAIETAYSVELKVRKSSVDRLGIAFTSAFSGGFDSIPDINPVKEDMFCIIEAGASYKGRLFRVAGARLDEINHEYVVIRLQEIEEHGTGGNI